MMHAYNEILLGKACSSLGRMLDFAVHSMHINAETAFHLFKTCGLAALFEHGDVGTITGMSGLELAYKILDESGISYERTSPRHTIVLSSEYWCGYALASLQWQSCMSFADILDILPAAEIIEIYESEKASVLDKLSWNADESERLLALKSASDNFCQVIHSIFSERSATLAANRSRKSVLKEMRIKNGLSQSMLAKASAVPLRTLQQYEQKQKNINKAGSKYIVNLARVLHCDAADLLEP